MQLTRETVTSAETWQTILAELPNAHPLQTWAWGQLKSRWGWSMLPTVWRADGVARAAAMLLKRKLPRTPFCLLYAPKGPIFDHSDVLLRRALLTDLQAMGHEHRAISVKIDPDMLIATGVEPSTHVDGVEFEQELQMAGWQFSNEQIQFRNTVTLDLTQSEEALLKTMKSKTRYNIRLSSRKGVTFRAADSADFDTLAAMYTETSGRNGFAIRPKAYYLDVWRTFQQAGHFHAILAEHEGDALAAVVLLHVEGLVLYMYGASTNVKRNLMAAHGIQWAAIQWAKANHMHTYDMWGAPNEFIEADSMWGVWRFKQGFNGTVRRHLGAYDYAPYPLLYKLYQEALPRYLDLLRKRSSS